MAFQNSYNNYIGRQKKNSTGLFKEKIKNSLSGVSVGNNTTNKTTTTNVTPNVLGKSTTRNIQTTGNGVPQVNLTQNNTLSASQSVSKPVQTVSQVNTNIKPTIASQTPTVSSVPTSVLANTDTGTILNTPNPKSVVDTVQYKVPKIPGQTAPGVDIGSYSNPLIPGQTAPGVDIGSYSNPLIPGQTAPGASTGMMSLSDINNALAVEPTLTSNDWKTVEQLASDPLVQKSARDKGTTPQDMAKELLEFQKQQLQRDWEQKKAELELQKQQAMESYQQSVTDANNTYQQTDEQLKLDRYTQQEDMNVDAQRRGVQYSPQQMALENVANINLNKNLADASKKRNELLNNLQIQINQSMANIVMGLQDATNNYNGAVSDLMSDYQKQMMDWAYTDKQTEEERKWQEAQTKKDQEFQKMMAELQNKWQAEQNALDRKAYKSGKSSGYGGYSSYSSNWKPYTWTPYNYASSNWGNYSLRNMDNTLDLSNQNDAESYLGTMKQASTDMYNALARGGTIDLNDRAEIYADEMDKIINNTKSMKNSDKIVKELQKTEGVALKHLFSKAYSGSYNVPYKVGDTIIQPKTPLKQKYNGKLPKSTQLMNEYRDYLYKNLYERGNPTWSYNILTPPSIVFDPSIPRFDKYKKSTKSKVVKNLSIPTSKSILETVNSLNKQKSSKKTTKVSKKISSAEKAKRTVKNAKSNKTSKRVKENAKKYSNSKKFQNIKKSSRKKLSNTYKNKTYDKKKTTKKTTRKPKTGFQRAWYNIKKNLFSLF